MAQTALTVTTVKQDNYAVQPGDLTVTMTASDTVNGNSFPITGQEVLLVQNTDVSAHTFSVVSVPDALGRSDTSLTNYSVAAGAIASIQFSTVSGWRQADGNVYLTSSSNLLKFGVQRTL